MQEGQIQIHTENIFPIIKKAVYSAMGVLRELVSNGVDAISKRHMAAMAGDYGEGRRGHSDRCGSRSQNTHHQRQRHRHDRR